MKLKFFARFVAITALLFAFLSFNWDRIELENRAFAVTLAIDPGEEAAFEVTINIADTKAMDSGEDSAAITRTGSGQSLAHAMGQAQAGISDKIYFGHTKAVVFGQGILAEENLLRETVDTLYRNNEINIKAIVTAAEGSAAEIMSKAADTSHGLLGVYLAGFYNNNNVGVASAAVKLDLEGLVAGLMEDGSAIIPMVRIDKEEAAIGGAAVVKGFRLAGHVEEQDLGGRLWFLENAAGTQIPIEKDGGHITFLTAKSAPRLKFYEEGGRLLCHVSLMAEGSIEGAVFMENSGLFDADVLAELEAAFGQKIKEELTKIFTIFREINVDGLGLHEKMRKGHPQMYSRLSWPAAFETMELVADVEVKIRNTGAVK